MPNDPLDLHISGSELNQPHFYDPSSSLGQLVTSEILMASESGCPIEMHKIEIEKCDEMYDSECKGNKFMPFHRAWYDHKTGQSPNSPREQVTCFTFSTTNRSVYVDLSIGAM